MRFRQLAIVRFEHHGWALPHHGIEWQNSGDTERGKEVGKGLSGCVSLWTSMNLSAQVEQAITGHR